MDLATNYSILKTDYGEEENIHMFIGLELDE